MPGTTKAEASLLDETRERRRGSFGWLGVFISLGLAAGGVLARFSGGIVALVSGSVLAISLVLINWTRLWLRESREPFPYTFSVGEFEPRPAADGSEADALLSWLSRDLIANLGDRVQRLSLFEPPVGEADSDRSSSHVHIVGWYGIRKSAKGDRGDAALRWQLEIVPQVRLGNAQAPAKLGQIVRYDLGKGSDPETPPPLTRDQYNGAFERVYWSVASLIYAEIGQAVEEKIELLPPGRLRAAAYLHEADDYATSNTLDAYAAARDLYAKAREVYDVTARRAPATRWRRNWRAVRVWLAALAHKARMLSVEASRRAARWEVLTARAELGQVRMQISEWHLKLLCGSMQDEIFSVIPLAEKAIARLEKLPDDVEEGEITLFRGRLTLAMAKQLLLDEAGAETCLGETKARHPMLARKDPEYFFVAGLNERARLRSQRLFGQAVELAPTMERAHFHRAQRSDDVWRSRPTFEAKVARTVDEEYQAVVAIDPGNIAAWANRGYMSWLLATGSDADKWRDRAFISLEAGRQYKEVRREAVVAKLDWNLARLAAEAGDFPKAYEHYFEAVSAQLGDTPFPLGDYFYENAGDALVERFQRYRERVKERAERVPKEEQRLADAVWAFVLNDCGMAFEFYRARSGDEEALDWAQRAFEEAMETGDSFVLPAYNLARLHQRLWEETRWGQAEKAEEHLVKAAELLDDVLRREPDWTPAQQRMVNVQAELAAMLADRIRELESDAKVAPAEPIVPGLLAGKPPEPESQRVKGGELKERRERCQKEFAHQLRRMLPHACFSAGSSSANGAPPPPVGHRIDAEGTQVAALVADEGIEWREEFTEFHVRALIEWAQALAADSDTAKPAFELCQLLRATYYRTDESLLLAHRLAALALHRQQPSSPSGSEECHQVVKECESLLEDRARRILADDPAHHGMLSSGIFEWFPEDEQRNMLLKARGASPSPLTLLSIGDRLQRMGETAEARKVFKAAVEDGGTAVAPVALMRLAQIHMERGKAAAALEVYLQAAAIPNLEVAPEATLQAIEILGEEQRQAEVLPLCEAVVALGAAIAVELGARLQIAPDRTDTAIAVFRRALETYPEDPAAAPAALGLARLLGYASEESEGVLRRAIVVADESTRVEAQVMLAQLLIEHRTDAEDEAETRLRAALESSVTLARGEAALLLARLLQGGDRAAEALPLFELAIAEGTSGTSVTAALELGGIRTEAGDADGAREAYRKTAMRESWNALALARVLHERGDPEAAEELCAIGADPEGPEPLFAPDARLLLGDLLSARGESTKAEEAYWQTIDSGDSSVTPEATLKLGELFEETERKALDAYAGAIKRLDEFAARSLIRGLVPSLEQKGDAETVRAVCRTGAEKGSLVALEVGDMLSSAERLEDAEWAYRLAAAPGSAVEFDGLLRLAGLFAKDDPAQSAALYRQVVERGYESHAAAAEEGLAGLAAAAAPQAA